MNDHWFKWRFLSKNSLGGCFINSVFAYKKYFDEEKLEAQKTTFISKSFIFGFMACDIFNSGIDKTEFLTSQFYGVLAMIILLIPALWIDYKWWNSKNKDS